MSEEKEKDLTLEKMRAKRNTAESLFKKFTEANDFFCTHAFCFYEGEDGKYYDSRVGRYWETNIVSFVAGNKKAVIIA